MRAEEVTKSIKSYMECDANTLQALVLYGEWGSGKTYYCEHVLKAALDEIDIKTCRVSLFGVSDYDEIISRVLASVFHICENPADRFDAAFNVVKNNLLSAGSSLLSKKLAELGIQVSIKPDLLLSLIDMKKVLVVFDDCERSSFAQDDRSFLGFVNNMVENHGWHVMLVRNEQLSFEKDCSVEKAVVRQIAFEPDSQELYKVAIQPKIQFPQQIDFDIENAILDGIKGSIINVRAIARSIPAINCVLGTSILVDTLFDSSGRARALSSFIGYAVQASAGKTPKKPNASKIAVNMIDDSKVLEYEDYLLISKALAPLTRGEDVSPTIVEDSFTEFVLAKNPDSAADLKAQDIVNQWHTMSTMEDDQVESFANQLEGLLSDGQYSHRWFPEIAKISLDLKNLGFWDETNLEKLLDSLKRAAGCDPQCSAKAVRQEIPMFNGFYGKEVGRILDVLATSIENEEYAQDLNLARFELSKIDSNTGVSISSYLEEAVKSQHPRKIFDLPAECVVKSIYEGTAGSQQSLQSFFHLCMKNYPDNESLGGAIEWLKDIDAQLDEVEPKSRMSRLRTKWIRGEIKEAIDVLNEKLGSAAADSDGDMIKSN